MYYLSRRQGRYYFRVRVPKDLVSLLGSTEIKRALRTGDLKHGKTLAKVWSYRAERLFMLARSGLMTDDQIRGLAEEYLHEGLMELEGNRASGYGPKDEDSLDAHLLGCEEGIYQYREALSYNDIESMAPVVDELLTRKCITLEKNSLEYGKVCREFLKAAIQVLEVEKERLVGNYDNKYDRSFDRLTHPSTPAAAIEPRDGGKTLSNVIKLYADEKASKKDWSYKTKLEMDGIFRLVLLVIGDRDIRTLDRTTFISFASALDKLPPNLFKKKTYKDKQIDDILKMVERVSAKPMAVKTRNKVVQSISTLMEWCADQGYVEKNYATKLSAKDNEKASEKRKAYSSEDIGRLLASPVYTKDTPSGEPEKFWIPLLALFTGARLNELCSLYLEDVQTIEGVPCIDINSNRADKKIKTESSERSVPIHPTLISMGFLGYVEKLKKENQQRLWPNLSFTRSNGYGGAFGKWYGHYSRKFITEDRKKVFHSFRHSLIDNLKQQEVDQKIIEAIDGHKDNSMTGGLYGKAYKPQVLLKALRKLDYAISFDAVKFPL